MVTTTAEVMEKMGTNAAFRLIIQGLEESDPKKIARGEAMAKASLEAMKSERDRLRRRPWWLP